MALRFLQQRSALIPWGCAVPTPEFVLLASRQLIERRPATLRSEQVNLRRGGRANDRYRPQAVFQGPVRRREDEHGVVPRLPAAHVVRLNEVRRLLETGGCIVQRDAWGCAVHDKALAVAVVDSVPVGRHTLAMHPPAQSVQA